MIRLTFGRARGIAKALQSPRFYGTNGGDGAQHEKVAVQMIEYALGHARSRRSGESYDEAMLVLEQGVSNLQSGGEGSVEAVGRLMLAMSTLLYERGKRQDAMEKLEAAHQLARAYLPFRVAACEGLAGLQMEAGQVVTSLVLTDDSLEQLASSSEGKEPDLEFLKLRAHAIKGLADLVNGDTDSAKSFFDGCQDCDVGAGTHHVGNAVLSYGEFLHCTGTFSLAKDQYERVLKALDTKDTNSSSYLASVNMVPDEVLLGATCALGQLLFHSGKFHEAEEVLTKALTKTEDHFGSTHPKVGAILTCIAMMFKQKAKMEASSSILLQEGLYRRALDLLKAPALDSEGADIHTDKSDIVALARGGYADLLCIQQNRKEEGERMRKWAEATWKNRRLSLAEALEFSEPSKTAVVDTRVCRIL
ncbi:uncharacterized protein [Typha angustifolia]|uniref:uncharacterized protein n=1 Tax=Typha angustifolia TaxID=59011 RepID=UPI003C2D8EB6